MEKICQFIPLFEGGGWVKKFKKRASFCHFLPGVEKKEKTCQFFHVFFCERGGKNTSVFFHFFQGWKNWKNEQSASVSSIFVVFSNSSFFAFCSIFLGSDKNEPFFPFPFIWRPTSFFPVFSGGVRKKQKIEKRVSFFNLIHSLPGVEKWNKGINTSICFYFFLGWKNGINVKNASVFFRGGKNWK